MQDPPVDAAKPEDEETSAKMSLDEILERRKQVFSLIASETHSAEAITSLARMTYVRALFKFRGAAGGKVKSASEEARKLTAQVVSKQLGFEVSAEDIVVIMEGSEPEETGDQTGSKAAATRRPSDSKTL
jgi:hypothetical protein